MPYFPIWSSVGIHDLGLQRDSNAPVENYFDIVKNKTFKDEKRVPIPRFISRQWPTIAASLRKRKYSDKLITSKSKKKRKFSEADANFPSDESASDDDTKDAIEEWRDKKRQEFKCNRYLTAKKEIEVKPRTQPQLQSSNINNLSKVDVIDEGDSAHRSYSDVNVEKSEDVDMHELRKEDSVVNVSSNSFSTEKSFESNVTNYNK